jgi:TonB-dependent Receptor Plug Domain
MSFLRDSVEVGFARSNTDCGQKILDTKAMRDDRTRNHRKHSSLYGSSAILKPVIASGLLYLTQPHAALAQQAGATQELPPVVVVDPGQKPKPKLAKRVAPTRTVTSRGSGQANQPAQEAGNSGTTPAQAALDRKMEGFDQQRDHILTKLGASTDTIDRAAILAGPQGDNTPVDKLVLQFPGVNYDSAVSNPNFHVRGEYNNVQTRINGFVLPEGVSGLGPLIDTNFISSLSLLTGALPAQYGLRTAFSISPADRSQRPEARSASMAAVTARSRRVSTMVAASATPSISFPAAAISTTSASKIRRPRSTRSTITPTRASSLPMCRRRSTIPSA